MINQDHYHVVLKAKPGELGACGSLSALQKGQRVTAYLEINETPDDLLVRDIAKSWGTDDRLIVETVLELEAERKFLTSLSGRNVRTVPAVTTEQSDARIVQAAGLATDFDQGLCLRIPGMTLVAQGFAPVARALRLVQMRPEAIQLVVDFNDIRKYNLDLLRGLVIGALRNVATPERWKALVLVASSIPKTLSEVAAAGQITAVARKEWKLFNDIIGERLPRIPTYGDFAVNHPDRGVRVVKYSPSANIRYTSESDFLIARALKRKSNEASRELCQMLISDPRFMGKDFSDGDREIVECAEGKGGVGNGSTWRRRDTRHHIEFKLQQLANLF
jgi:hypothetical protein